MGDKTGNNFQTNRTFKKGPKLRSKIINQIKSIYDILYKLIYVFSTYLHIKAGESFQDKEFAKKANDTSRQRYTEHRL